MEDNCAVPMVMERSVASVDGKNPAELLPDVPLLL